MKILIQRKGWAEWELGHNLSEIAPRNDNLWQADSLMTTLYYETVSNYEIVQPNESVAEYHVISDGVIVMKIKNGLLNALTLNRVDEYKHNSDRGHRFFGFTDMKDLETLNLPNLEKTDNGFLSQAYSLKHLSAPKWHLAKDDTLSVAPLATLDVPSLQSVGANFMKNNEELVSFKAPKLTKVGKNCLYNNNSLTELNLPKLHSVGSNFLYANSVLESAKLPRLTTADNTCQPLVHEIAMANARNR